MRRISNFLGILCGIAMVALFLVIYILTVYIAYLDGFAQMLLTMVLPFVAQIYWIYHIGHLTGTFLNTLTVLCIVWVVLAISTFALSKAGRETA
jgi:hypothetical protein